MIAQYHMLGSIDGWGLQQGTVFLIGSTFAKMGGATMTNVSDIVSLYKAPGKGGTNKMIDQGFNPKDYPGSGNTYPDGKAYFGLGDAGLRIAQDYASRGSWDPNVVKVDIPRGDFDKHFAEFIGSHSGVPNVEVAIPNNMFNQLNQYPRTLLGPIGGGSDGPFAGRGGSRR